MNVIEIIRNRTLYDLSKPVIVLRYFISYFSNMEYGAVRFSIFGKECPIKPSSHCSKRLDEI